MVINHSNVNHIFDLKELSDEEVVQIFVETKDEEIFNELVDRYSDKIYGLALRITKNPADSEDIMQNVFIMLIEKLYTFRGESKFSTWLYRVVSNLCFLKLRLDMKYKKNVTLEGYISYEDNGIYADRGITDWSGKPDDIAQKKELLKMIEEAVNELPADYRVVFHLRDIEGMTNREVATILGLSLSNVKSKIYRARIFLKDKLSDYFIPKGKYNSYSITSSHIYE